MPNLGTSLLANLARGEVSGISLVPKLGTSLETDISKTTSRAIVARSRKRELSDLTSAQVEQKLFFIPDELSGISLSDNLSGSYAVTSDQLGLKLS